MATIKRIEGQGFSAQVQGQAPWRFTYMGTQTLEVESYGQQIVVLHSQIQYLPELEQEQVFDAFWTLAQELGFERVCIRYRVSDPHETFVVRSCQEQVS
jgi:hypothetical protein